MQIQSTMLQHYSLLGSNLKTETGEDAQTAAKIGTTTASQTGLGASGDTVRISEEARSMAIRSDKAGTSEDSGKTTQEQTIDRIKEQIQKLQEEIRDLQGDATLTDEERQQQMQVKQSELMQLQTELQEAMEQQAKAEGQSLGGGTRANGFANSLT